MTMLLENDFSELNTLFIIASCRSQAADWLDVFFSFFLGILTT